MLPLNIHSHHQLRFSYVIKAETSRGLHFYDCELLDPFQGLHAGRRFAMIFLNRNGVDGDLCVEWTDEGPHYRYETICDEDGEEVDEIEKSCSLSTWYEEEFDPVIVEGEVIEVKFS